ncbi:MAG: response regulator [Desulfuromusa sp.]|nr:response regulator [Desulfuromusa sp.]
MVKVLIVDDEENTRIGLVKLLTQEGYHAEAVANGFEALEYLKKGGIGLVLTDINMPEMNGLVFLQELNQTYPEIKVVMITAYGGVGSYLEAMNQGALEYLHKPVKLRDLRAVLNKTFNPTDSLGNSSALLTGGDHE